MRRSIPHLRRKAVGFILLAVAAQLAAFAPPASAAGCTTNHGNPTVSGNFITGTGWISCDDERLVGVLVCITTERGAPLGPCVPDNGNGFASATATAALCSSPTSLYRITIIAADEFGNSYDDASLPVLILCPR